MAIDLERLLSMAPGIAAGAMGNQAGGAAFMQGLEEGRQIRLREQMIQQQQGRQSELDASRLQTEEAKRQNLEADNQRQAFQAQEQSLMRAIQTLQPFLDQAATAPDMNAAMSGAASASQNVEQQFGLPQGMLAGQLQGMSGRRQRAVKAAAQAILDRAARDMPQQPGQQNPFDDPSLSIQIGPDHVLAPFAQNGAVKPSQIRELAGDATFLGAPPMKGPRRPLQRVETVGSGGRPVTKFLTEDEVAGQEFPQYVKPDPKMPETGADDPFLKTIMENPGILDTITPSARAKYLPLLAKMGFEGFGRPMSDAAVGKVSESKSAVASLRDLRDVLQKNEQFIGPVAGLSAVNPYSKARQAQSDIDRVRQRVGKALEGGVLRKEDEVKYKKILATLTDVPETAIYKVDQLIQDIERDISIFEQEQKKSGRRVTATMPTDGGVTVTMPDGQTATFPTQAAADAFKKEAGIR